MVEDFLAPFTVNRRPAKAARRPPDWTVKPSRTACIFLGEARHAKAAGDAKAAGFDSLSGYICFLIDNAKFVTSA
jgi:hypothetical protein